MLTRKLSPLGRLNPSNAITTQSTIINSSKIQELTNQIDQLSDALKDRAQECELWQQKYYETKMNFEQVVEQNTKIEYEYKQQFDYQVVEIEMLQKRTEELESLLQRVKQEYDNELLSVQKVIDQLENRCKSKDDYIQQLQEGLKFNEKELQNISLLVNQQNKATCDNDKDELINILQQKLIEIQNQDSQYQGKIKYQESKIKSLEQQIDEIQLQANSESNRKHHDMVSVQLFSSNLHSYQGSLLKENFNNNNSYQYDYHVLQPRDLNKLNHNLNSNNNNQNDFFTSKAFLKQNGSILNNNNHIFQFNSISQEHWSPT